MLYKYLLYLSGHSLPGQQSAIFSLSYTSQHINFMNLCKYNFVVSQRTLYFDPILYIFVAKLKSSSVNIMKSMFYLITYALYNFAIASAISPMNGDVHWLVATASIINPINWNYELDICYFEYS